MTPSENPDSTTLLDPDAIRGLMAIPAVATLMVLFAFDRWSPTVLVDPGGGEVEGFIRGKTGNIFAGPARLQSSPRGLLRGLRPPFWPSPEWYLEGISRFPGECSPRPTHRRFRPASIELSPS